MTFPPTGTFTGAQGVKLARASFPSLSQPPRASVLLMHGYGEHMGRYEHVIRALAARGYSVETFDHRNHGQSEGVKADCEKFEYFVDDAEQALDLMRREQPGRKYFLLAHSMGGLIAAHLLLRRQQDFAGAVLSGPALSFGADQPGWMKAMAGVIAALVPLREITGLGRGAAESVLSRDPEIQAKFNADPLCWNGGVRARMGYQLLRGAGLFGDSDSKLTLPLLLMVGEADTIVDPVRNKLLFDRASSVDKTFRVWPGARHEIYNELDKADTIAVTLDWLDSRTAA